MKQFAPGSPRVPAGQAAAPFTTPGQGRVLAQVDAFFRRRWRLARALRGSGRGRADFPEICWSAMTGTENTKRCARWKSGPRTNISARLAFLGHSEYGVNMVRRPDFRTGKIHEATRRKINSGALDRQSHGVAAARQSAAMPLVLPSLMRL